MADGGGDFTVVSIVPCVVTVLFVVDSVMIGSIVDSSAKDGHEKKAKTKTIHRPPILILFTY